MNARHAVPGFGLLVAVTACGQVLGVDGPSERVECNTKQPCGEKEQCITGKCLAQGGAGGRSLGSITDGTGSTARNAGTCANSHGGNSAACGSTEVGRASNGCIHQSHRCFTHDTEGHPVYWQTCNQGTWEHGTNCSDYCETERGCIDAPSCRGMEPCGTNLSCCSSTPLPGGEFERSPVASTSGESCTVTSSCRASISAFSLDIYEVTIGRFRRFVAEYPNHLPVKGSGKSKNIPSDPGWDDTWNSNLPVNQRALVDSLRSCAEAPELSTYTDTPLGNEFLPVGCLTWYLAYAFCIWDGGRLPTELEWDYAASGGEGRYFPWSVPRDNAYISGEYAVYTPAGAAQRIGPATVGVATKGVARWGHYDLAGNALEWIADAYDEPHINVFPCYDCAALDGKSPLRVTRGGAYLVTEKDVTVAGRWSAAVDEPLPWLGFRCARDL